ncbi:LamG domain-containing protein [Actinocorallia sp. API 0066]|uniref:LamG domain-containing protein n=1 Tax=Actinocorallia sp. API 0066 TaxID=2896846 RepID=UPI001E63BBC9|nr:LamG domain-containing protein [Actinocorallia sp. API 0066]MCD0453316.1 LamG domain-containing protein [Actinocorallia sp. API 0066]
MSDDLVLHWPLTALAPQSTVLDSGPRNLNGQVRGVPVPVTDPKFACLRFDGRDQYVAVPAGPPALELSAYTLSAWISWTPGADPRTVAVFGKSSPNLRLRLTDDGTLEHLFASSQGLESHSTAPGEIGPGVWRHVAITHDGAAARILVDGEERAAVPSLGTRTADREELWLACGNGSAPFPGLMARFRVYARALSAAEIRRDMADDEPPLELFVRSHPLDFDFVNNDGQPVLFIADTADQVMTLEVSNSSRADVEAVPLAGVSASTFHLALRLRRGTLAPGVVPKSASPDWDLAAEPDGTALYLRWRDNLKPIPPGGTVSVDVAGLNADGTGGTHGTQVELEYGAVRYVGQTRPLAGTRVQYLDVVNHRGRRDLPIDLRFVGGDRVLSDGATVSALTLHLTNVMGVGRGISFPARSAAFRVSFDAEPDGAAAGNEKPWALTTVGAAGGVTLSASPGWTAVKVTDAERAWDVTADRDTLLAPGQYVELRFDAIRGLPRPGRAPILVEYRDIPGYAGGTMTASVERTPLLFGQAATGVALTALGGRIGIGTAAPQGRLHVVNTNENSLGGALYVGPTNQAHLRIGHHQDYSWIQSGGGKPLAINPLGTDQVAIGTSGPLGGKVTVTHPSAHLQLRRDSGHGGGGQILYLELYQDATNGSTVTYPNIRFHHSNKFWNRIEGRPEGIAFKWGTVPNDSFVDVFGQTFVASTGFRIGDVTIGAAELRILKKLAAGSLEFDLFNVKQGEYAYAADYNPYDNDRRYVWTWRRKGRVDQGRWRITYPS